MESRSFGSQSIPAIGQGTWEIERGDRAGALKALRRGIDLGMTHVDTAEMYGAGRAEEIVGEAIKGIRDRVFLVSKVLPSNASYEGSIQACERSLKRLGTDRLDVYLLHWRGGHDLKDTFRAFEALREQGKIVEWGVSNFDEDDLAEAEGVVGPGKLACNQVLYHLEERAIEHAVIPWCEKHRVPVVAYSPFGSGRFPSPGSKAGKALAEVAEFSGMTPRQAALRFLLRYPSVFPIPKAATVAHVEENAAAGDLVLPQDAIDRLSAAFPRGKPRPLPMI